MSMYRGPLSKMIDEAVEKRMTALKNIETEAEAEDTDNRPDVYNLGSNVKTDPREKGKTMDMLMEFNEVAPDEHYQEMGYENREDFIRQSGRGGNTDAEIEDNRYHSSKFYESANPVDVSQLKPEQRKRLAEVYGGEDKIDKLDFYEKDGNYYIDQGAHMTNEMGVTRPLEVGDRTLFEAADAPAPPEATDEQDQSTAGVTNVRELFGVDSEVTPAYESSNKLSYMQFSDANPTFDFLNDDKMMKKARKAYNKFKKQGGLNNRDKAMPFFEFVMKKWDDHGQGPGRLVGIAKKWETANKPGRESGSGEGLEGGAATSVGSYHRQKPLVEGGEQAPPTNMRRMNTKPVSKMLQGRTMSFRKNKF